MLSVQNVGKTMAVALPLLIAGATASAQQISKNNEKPIRAFAEAGLGYGAQESTQGSIIEPMIDARVGIKGRDDMTFDINGQAGLKMQTVGIEAYKPFELSDKLALGVGAMANVSRYSNSVPSVISAKEVNSNSEVFNCGVNEYKGSASSGVYAKLDYQPIERLSLFARLQAGIRGMLNNNSSVKKEDIQSVIDEGRMVNYAPVGFDAKAMAGAKYNVAKNFDIHAEGGYSSYLKKPLFNVGARYHFGK